MNSRERVIKTLKFESVDKAPRDLFYPQGIAMFRKDELDDLLEKYPLDFTAPHYSYGKSGREKGESGVVGDYTDAWGCVFRCAEPGVVGEVKKPPLDDWDKLKTYKIPWELIENADLSRVNEFCKETDKFVFPRLTMETHPFERMQFLRGTENLYTDLAYKRKEVYILRDMLQEFFIKDMSMWADTDVGGVTFMDDWGSQQSLLISPDFWRSFFKPLYREYCEIIHKKGKYAFFHSDGYIEPIYPDLIEIGIDAINSQLFVMDIEELAKKYKGKFTAWGEIDRQKTLRFGSVEEVRKSVRRVRAAFDDNHGGVIAQCSWGLKDPKANIEAVYDEWMKPM